MTRKQRNRSLSIDGCNAVAAWYVVIVWLYVHISLLLSIFDSIISVAKLAIQSLLSVFHESSVFFKADYLRRRPLLSDIDWSQPASPRATRPSCIFDHISSWCLAVWRRKRRLTPIFGLWFSKKPGREDDLFCNQSSRWCASFCQFISGIDFITLTPVWCAATSAPARERIVCRSPARSPSHHLDSWRIL